MNCFVEPPPVVEAELLATVVGAEMLAPVVGVEVAPSAGSVDADDGLVLLAAWVVGPLALVAVGAPALPAVVRADACIVLTTTTEPATTATITAAQTLRRESNRRARPVTSRPQ